MTVTNDFVFEKDVEVAAGAMNSGGLGGGSGLGGLSGLTGSMNRSGGTMGSSGPAGLQYSIPGILHFLQHEWARFEMERGQWEVEKAELQVILKSECGLAKIYLGLYRSFNSISYQPLGTYCVSSRGKKRPRKS